MVVIIPPWSCLVEGAGLFYVASRNGAMTRQQTFLGGSFSLLVRSQSCSQGGWAAICVSEFPFTGDIQALTCDGIMLKGSRYRMRY